MKAKDPYVQVLNKLEKLEKELKEKDKDKVWGFLLDAWKREMHNATFYKDIIRTFMVLIDMLYEEKERANWYKNRL